jgi:putative transposase
MSVRDIQDTLKELHGVDVSPATLSAISDKVWRLVEEWQNRPLAALYGIVYLDAIHLKIRREGRVETVAVYTVLGVELDGLSLLFSERACLYFSRALVGSDNDSGRRSFGFL